MKIDLHLHSCYSKDALSTPKTIVKKAKQRGLTGIAITDHGTTEAWGKLTLLGKKEGLLVIKGEELKVKENNKTIGELSALFMQTGINACELSEVLELARQQDALLIIQHPFDLFRKPWKRMGYWSRFHGIEAFNSRCILNTWNKKAMKFARDHGFPVTAGSDAHTPWEIGNAFVECDCETEEELRKAIIKRKVRVAGKLSNPLIHFFSTIAKLQIIKEL